MNQEERELGGKQNLGPANIAVILLKLFGMAIENLLGL
jgi:hypothetical protein